MKRVFSVSALIRGVIIAVAAFFMIWSCCSRVTMGTFAGILLFGGIIACTVFYKQLWRIIARLWGRWYGNAAVISVGVVVVLGIFAAVFFSVNMSSCIYRPLERVDTVIVLGCRVKGETPSSLLAARCYAAAQVLNEHPDSVCIVSGGQGAGEDISEAEAMRRLLTGYGISPDRIYMEDKSTSTAENFAFSAALMEREGIPRDNTAVVTSDYHQYRASLYAQRAGLTDTGHYSGGTSRLNILNCWLREWVCLLANALFGY